MTTTANATSPAFEVNLTATDPNTDLDYDLGTVGPFATIDAALDAAADQPATSYTVTTPDGDTVATDDGIDHVALNWYLFGGDEDALYAALAMFARSA